MNGDVDEKVIEDGGQNGKDDGEALAGSWAVKAKVRSISLGVKRSEQTSQKKRKILSMYRYVILRRCLKNTPTAT